MGLRLLNVTRRQFLDRQLGETELRAAAEIWRCTYLVSAERTPDRAVRAEWRLEARLFGFPRRDGGRLLQRVEPQLRPLGFTCTLRDPDTMEILGPSAPAQAACDVSGWTRLLSIAELDGLCACLRISIVLRRDGEFPLVLFGVLRDGGLLLKSAWEDRAQDLFTKAQWRHEQSLMAGIHWYVRGFHTVPRPDFHKVTIDYAFGGTGQADPMEIARKTLAAGNSLSFSRGTHRVVHGFLWLWFDRPGQRKLLTFLARLAIGATALSVGAVGAYLLQENFILSWLFVAIALLGVLVVARVIWAKCRTIARYHAAMGKGLAKLYAGTSLHVRGEFPPELLASDPIIRKLTADIEAAGGRHCYDFHIDSSGDAKHHSRLFLFPEQQTYLSVSFMTATRSFQLFPAKATLVAQTFFTDGSRIFVTSSGRGYRRGRPELNVVARYWDGADVGEMLDRHVKLLDQLQRDGRRPVLPPAESMMQKMQGHFEQARELVRGGRPVYTWGDALHEGFGIMRREYRGD